MTDTIVRDLRSAGAGVRLTASDQFTAPGASAWLALYDSYTVQITGDATSVSVRVERSTRDPALSAGPDTAVVDVLFGAPASGLAPSDYFEDGAAWVRVNLTAVSGGGARVVVSGRTWG